MSSDTKKTSESVPSISLNLPGPDLATSPPPTEFARSLSMASSASTTEGTLHEEINPDDLIQGDLIGSGTFGSVYKGTLHGQSVAIKVLYGANSSFLKELQVLSALHHVNVVRLLGAVTTSKPYRIVTELFPNGSLRDYMRNHVMTLQLQLNIIMQLSAAMAYLHSKGMAHRDMKLENVLVEQKVDGIRVAVGDFGVAKYKTDASKFGTMAGTFPYLAPEVYKGQYTSQVDLYSFGILINEILSGEEAWKGKNAFEIMDATFQRQRPKLATCPAELQMLIQWCWDQEPANRPSFAEVYTIMKAMVAGINEHGKLGPPSVAPPELSPRSSVNTQMSSDDVTRNTPIQLQHHVPCGEFHEEGDTDLDGSKSVKKCQACDLYLCDYHATAHRRSKSTSKHHLIAIEYHQIHQSPLLSPTPALSTRASTSSSTLPTCPIHPSHQLKVFCQNCQHVICMSCSLSEKHKGHETAPILQAATVAKTELEKSMNLAKDIVPLAKSRFDEAESRLKETDEKVVKIKRSINEFFDNIRRALDNRQELLMANLTHQHESYALSVEQDRDTASTILTKLSENMNRAQQLVKDNQSQVQLVNEKDSIVKQLKHLSLMVGELPEVLSPLVGFEGNSESIISGINDAGSVFLSAPFVQNCKAEGSLLEPFQTIGVPSSLTISVRDQQGKRAQIESSHVVVSIGRDRLPVSPISGGAGGEFQVNYVPEKEGFMLLSVSVCGKPFPGFPREIKCAAACPEKCRVEGTLLSGGFLRQSLSLQISVIDHSGRPFALSDPSQVCVTLGGEQLEVKPGLLDAQTSSIESPTSSSRGSTGKDNSYVIRALTGPATPGKLLSPLLDSNNAFRLPISFAGRLIQSSTSPPQPSSALTTTSTATSTPPSAVGQFVVEHKPQKEGKLQLSVSVCGTVLPGFPREITIGPFQIQFETPINSQKAVPNGRREVRHIGPSWGNVVVLGCAPLPKDSTSKWQAAISGLENHGKLGGGWVSFGVAGRDTNRHVHSDSSHWCFSACGESFEGSMSSTDKGFKLPASPEEQQVEISYSPSLRQLKVVTLGPGVQQSVAMTVNAPPNMELYPAFGLAWPGNVIRLI